MPSRVQSKHPPLRHWIGAAYLSAYLSVLLGSSYTFSQSSVQCCNSLTPELPPATAYGATISRNNDPRNNYRPHVPMPIDAPLPADVLWQKLSIEELRLGPYSAGLVPDLQGLGAALFQSGDYRNAIEVYGKAIHVLRVNEGLNTVLQTGLVEQMIEAQIALGNFVAADRKQAYLYRILRSALPASSSEMLAATEQYADWNRTAYIAHLDRDRYPRIVDLMDLYDDGAGKVAEEQGPLSRMKLPYLKGKLKAQYLLSIYPGESEEGLQVSMQQNKEVDLPDLKRLRFKRFQDGNYRYGKQTIIEMRDILVNDPQTNPQELADVQLALADWYQWHHFYAEALQTYREAWDMMVGETGGANWLQTAFGEPLELPQQIVFYPGRISIQAKSTAQVTVQFEVNRLGEAKDIEVVYPSAEEHQPAVTRAYKYLRDMRFRPRFVNGKAVTTQALERNYTIHY